MRFESRGIGKRHGPRGRMIASEQVGDIRNTLTFFPQQDEADGERIGVWCASTEGSMSATQPVLKLA